MSKNQKESDSNSPQDKNQIQSGIFQTSGGPSMQIPSSASQQKRKQIKIKVMNPAILTSLKSGKRTDIFQRGLGQNPNGSQIDGKAPLVGIGGGVFGGLQRGNSKIKSSAIGSISGSFGNVGQAAASLAGGIGMRTTSRGGISNQLGDRSNSIGEQTRFYGAQKDYQDELSPQNRNEGQQFRKLVVNQELAQKPQEKEDQNEKEKQQKDYKIQTDNFSSNNYLGPVGGVNAIVKSKRFTQNQDNLQAVRPSTPEQQKKSCLNCGNMEDFIKGLQGEIQRLQNLTNDLQMQLILAGVNPSLPVNNEKKPFENVCPNCAQTKALQRPASSSRNILAARMKKDNDFKIKKGQSPAALAVIKQRRQIFELEQHEFVQDMKAQLNHIQSKQSPKNLSGTNFAQGLPLKMKRKKNNVDLSPINKDLTNK